MANETGFTHAELDAMPSAVRERVLATIKQNEALTKAVSGSGKFSLKVGEKGGMVVSGFGRFPHTFYVEQWDSFEEYLTKKDGFATIRAFITANKDALKTRVQNIVEANAPKTDAAN